MEDEVTAFIRLAKAQLLESLKVKQALAEGDQLETMTEIARSILECYRAGGKVIFVGNGGSAADAQHLACELVGRFEMERSALPAVALNVNSSIVTAVGNDYGFDRVFARQIEAWAKPEDVVVFISTSGNSSNVVEAIEASKAIGAKTVGFTGRTGGRIRSMVDLCLQIPSDSTPRIQESHITAGHIICSLVERAFFKGRIDG
ncbi:MAG: D-sedoheptulose 7-phosphate isomerase [Chloroflexi bacterium]|nr:D-sedoheptulose 7-phosphate isomerase [Chloroflexota bacterium]